MLSVIIPAREEIYLEKTIRNVLANAEGEIEVLVALDGWLPNPPFDVKDNRAIFYPFEKTIGQRGAINFLVKQAKGEYIMKLDAHCAVDKGFDVKLAMDCKPEWTVIPRMYNLDVETWKPKDFDDFSTAVRRGKLHDYISMEINEKGELRTAYYPHAFNKELHHSRKDILIDDTLSCMGCCFFMHKARFLEQGGCDEGHEGGWGQQAIEVACKAWLSGGSLKVNKKTWFAHYFRGGGGEGFPYPISGEQIDRVRAYSTDLWLNDKWNKATRKFQWIIDKFNPPNWKGVATKMPTKVYPSVERLIRNMFNCRATGHPSPIAARKGDRNTLIEVWARAGYKVGAEIGVGRGEFSERILNKGLTLHCIDAWDTYPDSQLTMEKQKENYARTLSRLDKFIKDGKCFVYKEYSEKATEKFADGSLDFLFIDGMHTFDGCVLDLIKWSKKVKKGGMIAVHDYCPMNRNGVIRAVDGYTYCHQINPWYITREIVNTAFWVVV